MAVRKHLLDRGFYLNDGIKYGLDFLVYTDHPDKVHSKYGLAVYNTMTFQQLVSYQRVCNSNNKALIIAFVDARDLTNIKLVQCERFIVKPIFQSKASDESGELVNTDFSPNEKIKDEQ